MATHPDFQSDFTDRPADEDSFIQQRASQHTVEGLRSQNKLLQPEVAVL